MMQDTAAAAQTMASGIPAMEIRLTIVIIAWLALGILALLAYGKLIQIRGRKH